MQKRTESATTSASGYDLRPLSKGERERLVRSIGKKPAVILRNHGLLAWGPSVSEAFMVLWTLQRACGTTIRADMVVSTASAAATAAQRDAFDRILGNHLLYCTVCDNNNGNWPLANQTLAKSLAFAGYDYRFEYGQGFHSAAHGRAILPDSLRWLWRDWKEALR